VLHEYVANATPAVAIKIPARRPMKNFGVFRFKFFMLVLYHIKIKFVQELKILRLFCGVMLLWSTIANTRIARNDTTIQVHKISQIQIL